MWKTSQDENVGRYNLVRFNMDIITGKKESTARLKYKLMFALALQIKSDK